MEGTCTYLHSGEAHVAPILARVAKRRADPLRHVGNSALLRNKSQRSDHIMALVVVPVERLNEYAQTKEAGLRLASGQHPPGHSTNVGVSASAKTTAVGEWTEVRYVQLDDGVA